MTKQHATKQNTREGGGIHGEPEESIVINAVLREIDANFGVKCGEPTFSRSCATDVT